LAAEDTLMPLPNPADTAAFTRPFGDPAASHPRTLGRYVRDFTDALTPAPTPAPAPPTLNTALFVPNTLGGTPKTRDPRTLDGTPLLALPLAPKPTLADLAPAAPDATAAASAAAASASLAATQTRRRAVGGSDLVTLPSGNGSVQPRLLPQTLIGH
jgi:hypothetical protein